MSSDANNHIIISQAGSYYLSGNLAQTKNTGINVTVAGVTVDLNGFQITASSGSAKIGIVIQLAADNCAVKNGSINGTGQAMTNGVLCVPDVSNPPKPANGTFHQLAVIAAGNGLTGGNGWKYEGCSAKGGTGDGFLTQNACTSTVSDCVASQNAGSGFNFQGPTNFLNCQAIGNSGIGFYVFGSGIFSNCTASGNQQRGFQAGNGSALTNCSGSLNGTGGITIQSGTLSNCAATSNTGIGFDLGFGVALTGCTSTANSSHGFLIQYAGSLTGCTAYNNGNSSQSNAVGIYCGSGSLQNCTASQNTGNGILMSTNSSVIGCLAQGNGLSGAGAGINVGDGSTVRDCDASYNQADGIIGTQQCQIVGNLALGNCIGGAAGVAGIRVTGGENRIEGKQRGAKFRRRQHRHRLQRDADRHSTQPDHSQHRPRQRSQLRHRGGESRGPDHRAGGQRQSDQRRQRKRRQQRRRLCQHGSECELYVLSGGRRWREPTVDGRRPEG